MEWWRTLKGRPFYWALDESDPISSYYMLRYVVERPDAARAVQAARLALQESEAVAQVKETLTRVAGARWEPPYTGPLWALRLLAEWGVAGDDERIAETLDWALDQPDDDFDVWREPLLLYCANTFGFGDDDRLADSRWKLFFHLNRFNEWDNAAKRTAWERWVALVAMAGAAAPATLSADTLAETEHALSRIDRVNFMSNNPLCYPTYDQPDGLTVVESALRLGLRGDWLTPWVEALVDLQDEQGLWRVARPLPLPAGLTPPAPDSPNRWLTAKALYCLRTYYGE